jgi:hypothetical protein
MEEEFDLCIRNKVIPIPIGATGYISKKLWDRVMGELTDYYPNNNELVTAITELGNSKMSTNDLIANVLKAIGILQKA